MENLREYEERLEKRRNKYNPRSGAIYSEEESYIERNIKF